MLKMHDEHTVFFLESRGKKDFSHLRLLTRTIKQIIV